MTFLKTMRTQFGELVQFKAPNGFLSAVATAAHRDAAQSRACAKWGCRSRLSLPPRGGGCLHQIDRAIAKNNRRALAIEAHAEAKVRVAQCLETGHLADLFVEQGAVALAPQDALPTATKPLVT
jgi:hypothetical protein